MASDLYEQNYCIIDLETTGLNTKKDEILSIAVIPIRNLKIDMDKVYCTFVRPEKFRVDSVKYHGITENDLREAPRFEDIADEIEKVLKDNILVGYAVQIDVEFLKNAFKKKMKRKVKVERYVDVAEIEAWLLRKRGSGVTFRLDFESLIKIYRIDSEHRHSAIGDAYLTALVFLHQLSQLIDYGLNVVDLVRIGRRMLI
ncbi:exonuclease domain-containing protein [Geoglobus acetivorans]|uniref:3'-5' exonuclease n=1 Tax=Geoglobus acetivorans TaxID=565033 RepID=A0ABZ3H7E7_GEOAI|nr:3'-5' exonuclease [Geoglobus acetivorans]